MPNLLFEISQLKYSEIRALLCQDLRSWLRCFHDNFGKDSSGQNNPGLDNPGIEKQWAIKNWQHS